MTTADKLTHTVQYQQKDGSWRTGILAYTRSEAADVAAIGRKRTGRKTRIKPL